jgi:hypothetical protein
VYLVEDHVHVKRVRADTIGERGDEAAEFLRSTGGLEHELRDRGGPATGLVDAAGGSRRRTGDHSEEVANHGERRGDHGMALRLRSQTNHTGQYFWGARSPSFNFVDAVERCLVVSGLGRQSCLGRCP